MKLREYIKNSGFLLKEVKLARVWKHLTDKDTVIGIITAFRGEYPYEVNKKRNMELARSLRKAGYGYFFVDGSWIENKGTDEEEHVKEDSIFVIGTGDKDNTKLFNLLLQMAKKYDQEGFSFKKSGEDTKYEIIDDRGNVTYTYTSLGINKVADVYTKMRNRQETFVFETGYIQAGHIDRLVEKNL